MASLLSKFRIDYASLTMVVDITSKPKPETMKFFNDVLKQFKEREEVKANPGKT